MRWLINPNRRGYFSRKPLETLGVISYDGIVRLPILRGNIISIYKELMPIRTTARSG